MALGKVVFEADRLKIGTWTRLRFQMMDLVCKFDTTRQHVAWEIVEGPHRCKIDFAFLSIEALEIVLVSESVAVVNLTLSHIPLFYVEVRLNDERSIWRRTRKPPRKMTSSYSLFRLFFLACNDITEDQQASRISRHSIQAHPAAFLKALSYLIENHPHLHNVRVHASHTIVTSHVHPLLHRCRRFARRRPRWVPSSAPRHRQYQYRRAAPRPLRSRTQAVRRPVRRPG